MPAGRKSHYQEMRIKEYLSEITPKMFKHIQKVMDGDDELRKDQMVHKIIPKVIDKGLPTIIGGGTEQPLVIQISKEVADKNKLYDSDTSPSADSQGHT